MWRSNHFCKNNVVGTWFAFYKIKKIWKHWIFESFLQKKKQKLQLILRNTELNVLYSICSLVFWLLQKPECLQYNTFLLKGKKIEGCKLLSRKLEQKDFCLRVHILAELKRKKKGMSIKWTIWETVTKLLSKEI